MQRIRWAAAVVVATVCATPHAQSHKGHHHGSGELEVAIDGNSISLQLTTPLEDVLGFERRPRTDREREAVRTLSDRLSGAALFTLPSAARCRLAEHRWQSALLADAAPGGAPGGAPAGHPHAKAADDGHGDLTAVWRYECEHARELRSIAVNLFDAFRGLRTVKVQLAGPNVQRGATLTSAKRQISW